MKDLKKLKEGLDNEEKKMYESLVEGKLDHLFEKEGRTELTDEECFELIDLAKGFVEDDRKEMKAAIERDEKIELWELV